MTRRRARDFPAPARAAPVGFLRMRPETRSHAATVAVTVSLHGPLQTNQMMPPQLGRSGGALSVPSPLNNRLVEGFSGVPVSEYAPWPFSR